MVKVNAAAMARKTPANVIALAGFEPKKVLYTQPKDTVSISIGITIIMFTIPMYTP